MKIRIFDNDFSVCKVNDFSKISFDDEFIFVSKTDEELSLVCETSKVPTDVIVQEKGWKAFRIEGVLDFSLIGILSEISTVLAENSIGIFAVSTYNTDYIFVKKENFLKAQEALKQHGYEVI